MKDKLINEYIGLINVGIDSTIPITKKHWNKRLIACMKVKRELLKIKEAE